MRPWCVLPLLAACYSYAPIEPSAAPAGSEVRARITGAASDRVAPLLGTFDNRVLVGNVVENTAGAMVLQVPTGAMSNVTTSVVPLQTRVPLVPTDLVSLERRNVDVVRTSLLAGVLAAGIAAGVHIALGAGGKSEPGRGPTDPPPINRIPIRIWRVPF
ncbi:MAG TPA: hypothetical protein VIP11_18455 [Gemmatimonadaceae bacterium]